MVTRTRWMSTLNGAKKINRLTIPGTHDTGANHLIGINVADQCQSQSYQAQLESGVRFFDIRLVLVRANNNQRGIPDVNFAVHHGTNYQESYLDKESNYSNNPACTSFVLQPCIEFLKQNPTECIVMSIKQEKPAEDIKTFQDAFVALVRHQDREAKYFWVQNRVPTLEEARGRIVIVSRLNDGSYPADFLYCGINWPNWNKGIYQEAEVDVEDHYEDEDGQKWGKVSDHLDKASGKVANPHGGHYGGDADDFWYVTFTSYTPFPNLRAEVMNPKLLGYLNSRQNAPGRHKRLGTIVMDFPRQDVIDKIIDYAQHAYPASEAVYRRTGSTWESIACSKPTRIAVGPKGEAYVVDVSNDVYRFEGNAWTPLPGEKASDIGVGPDGSVWIVGTDRSDLGGSRIYKWDAGVSKWDNWAGTGIRIAVGSRGLPYVVSGTNHVLRCDGPGSWTKLGEFLATDIGVGPDDSVWLVNADNGVAPPTNGGFHIRHWNGTDWDQLATNIAQKVLRISVDSIGLPYLVDVDQNIWRYDGRTFIQIDGKAGDIGIGSDGSVWVVGA